MTRHSLRLGLIVLLVSGGILTGQQPTANFRHERAVQTTGAGPQQLSIDVPLLAGGAPFGVESQTLSTGESVAVATGGLSDLRLFDPSGSEVPYVLVSPPGQDATWSSGSLLPTPVTEEQSGFETDLGELLTVDRIRVSGLPAPFLKRMTLEGSGDRARWTTLVGDGTLFDLPDESLTQTELSFPSGAYRYLRVTWDDTNSGRVPLPRSVSVRHVLARVPTVPLTTPLTVERRPSEPGVSRYRLRLPGARLPVIAIDLRVGAEYVLRPATVTEARLTGNEVAPAVLGRSQLRQVVSNGVVASSLRVSITSPTEAEIDLLVDDGDNPPLAIESVTAVFADLPWIYFESGGEPVTARYGDTRLDRPRYDLEAILGSIDTGAPAATWGEVRELAPEPTGPPLAPLPTVGASLDTTQFEYVKAVSPGDSGLVALTLDAAVLAHSAGPSRRFADVRIVDDANRQVPYLLERQDEPLSLDVQIASLGEQEESPVEMRANESVYRVSLPQANLPPAQLVLATAGRVFRRQVSLEVVRPPDERRREPLVQRLSSAEWVHADRETLAPELTIPVPSLAEIEVFVRIQEGDNLPLPVEGARLLLPSHRLRFFRPADAPLQLVYGAQRLAAPSYDLVLLAPQLLGARAEEVQPGIEQPFGPGAPSPTPLVSPFLFWTVLVLAVLVLLGMIVRLVGTQAPAE